MTSFDLAVIKPNNFQVDAGFTSDDKDTLTRDVKDLVEFVPTEMGEMMHMIYTTIGMSDVLAGDTSMCQEDGEYVYQLCHLSPETNKFKEDPDNINGLASYLVQGRTKIYGNAVLMRSKIMVNRQCTTNSVDLTSVVDLLFNKLVHTGVNISCDNKTSTFEFTGNPIEGRADKSDMLVTELPLARFNLLMFYHKEPGEKINKVATRLLGTHTVFGDVALVAMSTENEFISISQEIMHDLWLVAGGSLASRRLKDDDSKTENGQLPVVNNRFTVLADLVAAHEVRCGCGTVQDRSSSGKLCSGCYREWYCSRKCQPMYWSKHKSDCLVGKNSIHDDNSGESGENDKSDINTTHVTTE